MINDFFSSYKTKTDKKADVLSTLTSLLPFPFLISHAVRDRRRKKSKNTGQRRTKRGGEVSFLPFTINIISPISLFSSQSFCFCMARFPP